MVYLENNTTFSGSDIKVYAYRSVDDFKGFRDGDEARSRGDSDDPLFPDDPFVDMSPGEIGEALDQSLSDVASGRTGSSINTSRVNPDYIDIVKQGSDRQALDLARKHQLAKQNNFQNRRFNKTGGIDRGFKPLAELGSLYSITYSSYREKNAVRTLGRVSAKSYTRGQRTIAGSMNFAIFQSHELMDFLKYNKDEFGNPIPNNEIVLLDQLPKFNLMMIMVNEYGGASILHLFGVTISTESQQSSVEDLALMNSVTFYAEDIMTIEDVGNVFETSLSMIHPTEIAGKTLKFYKGGSSQTLGSLMKNNSGNDSKIKDLINRSRGLF